MQAIHLAIATIPIAIYLILMGALRLRGRPLVTSGWRDLLTLAIACSGLVLIGPMQLFFPTHAAARLNGWVWVPLILLYVLGVLLVLLASKPRLIAYGLDEPQFRELFLQAARSVDPNAVWQGDVAILPGAGLQVAMEPTGTSRVYQVVHVGALRNLQDWIRLERAFVQAASRVTCPPSMAGWPFVLGGGLLLAISMLPLLSDPTAALAQLRDFLAR
ncbi:MAG: hypothetical protein D6753_16435 [Planctomycetota bacterium]|nr:MAG: hypothetical protein D6753_16435 [Planctomycetota bacterium]